jgi:hypothetical protein
MKFNMGCGRRKLPGWVNVDSAPASQPDQVWDLEETPWPWPDNCAEQVLFNHSLEHMGASTKVFLALMQELYRICAPGCQVEIVAPHPRHDTFLNDPTHVRPITPEMLQLFDKAMNDAWVELGAANTPLAHYTGVDFALVKVQQTPEQEYVRQINEGLIDEPTLARYARERLNVIKENRILLVARKPQSAPGSA